MSLVYLSTLDLPDAWFDELARRLPEVRIHRFPMGSSGVAPEPELLARAHLLHTSDWFPDATSAPALRGIQLDTSGVDHVRGTSLWASDVPIATLGGIAPVPMAEYALMSILELAHRMPSIHRLRDERAWPGAKDRLADLTPRAIAGATVGIVGYGRIGREISRLAAPFGLRVLGVRRTDERLAAGSSAEKFDTGRAGGVDHAAGVVPLERLDEVLTQSDFLVVVVPLTDLTRGMIGPEQLDRLPEGAYVINIARGGIVDESALRERLRSGRLAGAALDVFDDEPLPASSPWWDEPGVLVTPHVAGLAPHYHSQTLDLVVENLNRIAEGRPLLNEVNRVAGY